MGAAVIRGALRMAMQAASALRRPVARRGRRRPSPLTLFTLVSGLGQASLCPRGRASFSNSYWSPIHPPNKSASAGPHCPGQAPFSFSGRCQMDLCCPSWQEQVSALSQSWYPGNAAAPPPPTAVPPGAFNLIAKYVPWNARGWDTGGRMLAALWQPDCPLRVRTNLEPALSKGGGSGEYTTSCDHSWKVSEKPGRGSMTSLQNNLPAP